MSICKGFWAHFLLLMFVLAPMAAYALPGDADAVIRHCGRPSTEDMGTSPVTGGVQRELSYNELTLRFLPMGSGWSFATALNGQVPVSQGSVEAQLPCFRVALAEVATAGVDAIPTLRAGTETMGKTGYGVPFMWLLFGVGGILVVFLVLPTTRRRVQKQVSMPMETRPYRKPQVVGVPFRRRVRKPEVEG
jgi:hypothetical protein